MSVAVPVAAPPAVGDCLLDALPALYNVNSSSQGPYSYSQLRIGPCSGRRYGEIVRVGGEVSGSPVEATTDVCGPAASEYLGLPVANTRLSPPSTVWYPVTSTQSFVLEPSERQQAAGQSWSACLLYVPSGDTRTAAAPYSRSLRNAIVTGAQSALVGVCPDDDSWNGSNPGGCGAPHRAEIFATNLFGGRQPASRSGLLRTCRNLVDHATGIGDLAGDTSLQVQIRASSPDGYPVTGSDIPASAFVKCGIEVGGDDELIGSLLALTKKPFPWYR